MHLSSRPLIAAGLLASAVAFCAFAYVNSWEKRLNEEADARSVAAFQKLNDAKVFEGVKVHKLEQALGAPQGSWVHNGQWHKRWHIGLPQQNLDLMFILRSYLIASGTGDTVESTELVSHD